MSTDVVSEVIRTLRRLPKVNGDGHSFLETMKNLTVEGATEVVRQLKADNPGVADILKQLGYWFPKGEKHHIRATLICLAGVLAASQEEEQTPKLHCLP